MNNNFKIDFVGIGAAKCATTWIYECLKEHPQIELAPKDQKDKVLFFKDPDSREMKEYRSWFRREDTVKGDFHVHYLESEQALRRMKKHNENMKVIVCLRNPVERAWSHYNYYKFSSEQPEISFEEAAKKEPEIIDSGLYYKHLKKYYHAFDDSNILILIFEDLKEDQLNFIQNIYHFLGVKQDFTPPSLDLQINPTSFKQTGLGRLLHQRIAKPLLKNTKWAWNLKESVVAKKIIGGFSEAWGESKERKEMKPQMQKKLRNYYRGDIQKLEELTGRDLTSWK